MKTEPRELKYVIVKELGCECAILFNAILSHSMFKGHDIISAGFCKIYPSEDNVTVSCWGKSDTLGVGSRNEDDEIIRLTLRERSVF